MVYEYAYSYEYIWKMVYCGVVTNIHKHIGGYGLCDARCLQIIWFW